MTMEKDETQLKAWHRSEYSFEWLPNGELSHCVLISHPDSDIAAQSIPFLTQQLARSVRENLNSDCDVIPSQDAVTLVSKTAEPLQDLMAKTETIWQSMSFDLSTLTVTHHRIPVCYDESLKTDLTELSQRLGLHRSEIIESHLAGRYRLDMFGFIPGFLYLSGLDPRLQIARKSSPAISVPAGSVAIAEKMSGIYSLESPAGWWVIARTPLKLFDVNNQPPTSMQPLDTISFYQISFQEWLDWSND